ncbi:nucleoside 2-deoxyribosyltransferase [Mammaliicoccus sciuri]|nr:nucleoside 2-deoxyribosyltransferase [Mammaliicoccus sciuri]
MPRYSDKDKVVYSGGHILNQAFVEYRDKQHNQLAAIDGIEPYSPHKDASINDKSNAEQTGLAERILANDFKAMQESDVFIFDVLNEGLGTIAEMGIVLGMKHQAQKVVDYIEQVEDEVGYLNEDEVELLEQQLAIINKPVLCYCSDIRQGNGHIPDHPDRFEFSTNQFVYGVCLELTNGEGFISWDEVLERLEMIGKR